MLDDRIEWDTTAQQGDESFVAALPAAKVSAARASYPLLEARLGDDLPHDANACSPVADRLTDELDAAIKRINTELGGYTQSMLQYMSEVRRRWPEATMEMDGSVEARAEYRAFHDRVANDDLPRFEEESSDSSTDLLHIHTRHRSPWQTGFENAPSAR